MHTHTHTRHPDISFSFRYIKKSDNSAATGRDARRKQRDNNGAATSGSYVAARRAAQSAQTAR